MFFREQSTLHSSQYTDIGIEMKNGLLISGEKWHLEEYYTYYNLKVNLKFSMWT